MVDPWNYQEKMSERQTKAGNQEFCKTCKTCTHSGHAEQLLFSCLCSKVTLTLSHSLTLTLSYSHTLTLFQSLIQSLLTCWTSFVFISMLKICCCMRKLQWFLAGNQLYELKRHRIGWGGGPKKTIAIFGYKQRLLSLDMKTCSACPEDQLNPF